MRNSTEYFLRLAIVIFQVDSWVICCKLIKFLILINNEPPSSDQKNSIHIQITKIKF